MPTFVGPTRQDWTFAQGQDLAPGERRFWSYFGTQPRGRSALKTAGVWALVDVPSLGQVDAADRITNVAGESVPGVLMGGHIHEVTQKVADELTADGLGAYVTP